MPGGPLINRISAVKATPTTIKDTTMIHTIQPETFLRHHAQETARIVERYRRRRAAVSRTRRWPRTNVTAGA